MRILSLILCGVAGGILCGMGFGGGTLMIPIMTFLLGVPYRLAAWVNLIAFLPTAIVTLWMHGRKKMLVGGAVRYLLIFATLGVVGGVLLGGRISEGMMRHAFGCFLISIGALSAFLSLYGYFKKK